MYDILLCFVQDEQDVGHLAKHSIKVRLLKHIVQKVEIVFYITVFYNMMKY